jgi:hypothetical protein
MVVFLGGFSEIGFFSQLMKGSLVVATILKALNMEPSSHGNNIKKKGYDLLETFSMKI